MPTVVNAGCGPLGGARLPAMFDTWQQLRVDLDPAVQPDIVASVTDLSAIPTGSANAVWSAHCIEHLYAHEVSRALGEFHRVIADDGFACVIVPDLQAIASYIAADKLHEAIYNSAAGPISAHDMVYGFGAAIAQGRVGMAHRCGFTPSLLLQRMKEIPFGEIVVRRRPSALELVALVQKKVVDWNAEKRTALLAALEL
jgi:methyltransferase family protein